MRKTLLTLIMAMAAVMAYAQPQIGDWAKFDR